MVVTMAIALMADHVRPSDMSAQVLGRRGLGFTAEQLRFEADDARRDVGDREGAVREGVELRDNGGELGRKAFRNDEDDIEIGGGAGRVGELKRAGGHSADPAKDGLIFALAQAEEGAAKG